MLASRFSGRWDDSLEKDSDGNYFNDDINLFLPIINYLRNKSKETPLYPVSSSYFQSSTTTLDFYRMIEYYGMTQGIYPCALKIAYQPLSIVDPIHIVSSHVAKVKEWSTFQTESHRHSRVVSDFEVKLGVVQHIQLGWSYHNIRGCNENNGVGDLAQTVAIDLSRSCILENGKGNNVVGLEMKEGTSIRTEDYGARWFVDDKLVTPADEIEGGRVSSYTTQLIPTISIKGNFKITDIKCNTTF